MPEFRKKPDQSTPPPQPPVDVHIDNDGDIFLNGLLVVTWDHNSGRLHRNQLTESAAELLRAAGVAVSPTGRILIS